MQFFLKSPIMVTKVLFNSSSTVHSSTRAILAIKNKTSFNQNLIKSMKPNSTMCFYIRVYPKLECYERETHFYVTFHPNKSFSTYSSSFSIKSRTIIFFHT